MTNKEAHEKAKNEIPSLKNIDFSVWKNKNIFYMQAYFKNGRTKEYYGYTYKIDFDKKELLPIY